MAECCANLLEGDMKFYEPTKSDWDTIVALQDEGCAVVVLTPSDLEGADPNVVEDAMVDSAMKIILGHN